MGTGQSQGSLASWSIQLLSARLGEKPSLRESGGGRLGKTRIDLWHVHPHADTCTSTDSIP